jgi:hypothetical protein
LRGFSNLIQRAKFAVLILLVVVNTHQTSTKGTLIRPSQIASLQTFLSAHFHPVFFVRLPISWFQLFGYILHTSSLSTSKQHGISWQSKRVATSAGEFRRFMVGHRADSSSGLSQMCDFGHLYPLGRSLLCNGTNLQEVGIRQ